jgi:hypothetical protein
MFRRHTIVASLSLSALAVLAAGCSDDTPATPRAIFDGQLVIGSGNTCNDSGKIFSVGDFGNKALDPVKYPTKPIEDGATFDQGVVSVACSVKAVGNDEFDVDASVRLSGDTGGFFRVDGRFKTTGEQQDIHAIFSSQKSGNRYDETDRKCVVRYTTGAMGVTSGRVWGDIVCPTAENQDAQKSCQAEAQFRFENCAE